MKGRLGWSNRSDSRKGRSNQGPGQIDHGRLNTGMAVGTGGGIRLRLVVMEQASEQAEQYDRDNESCYGDPSGDAPFWMFEPQNASLFARSGSVDNNLVNGLKAL